MAESKIQKPPFAYRGQVPNGESIETLSAGYYDVNASHKVSQGVPIGCNENGRIINFSENGFSIYIDLFGNIAVYNRYYHTWNNALKTT